MILNIRIEGKTTPITIPKELLSEGVNFFSKLDADMNKGWQMSRDWVQKPNAVQRCQIVADKILTAIEKKNSKTMSLFAAYILHKLDKVTAVDIATNGDMLDTVFEYSAS